MRDPSEHLQPGELHVVALAGGGRFHEPEVGQIAQAGDEWVEEQAESDHTEELLPSKLENVVNIFICPSYFFIPSLFSYQHRFPNRRTGV